MTEPLNAAEHDAYWRPLGELLVERGLLSADELAAALDEQARTGGRLGEILIRRGLLSTIALTSTLSEQELGEEGDTSFGSGLRSALAGSQQLADGYEQATGKQGEQQLGPSLALIDAGIEALKASGNPNDKASVAKALSTLNITSLVGKIDFTSGPVANVSIAPIIGAQWVKGKKYDFDLVITDNAPDPNVPVAAKLLPYNG